MSESERIDREKTLSSLAELSISELRWLAAAVDDEHAAKRRANYERRQFARQGWAGLCSFMAGVTWALACRASLRDSKGHEPVGRGIASGEMWYPWEMVYAQKHEVKQRGWSPLSCQRAGDAVLKLLVESQRKDVSKAPDFVKFDVQLAGDGVRHEVCL